MGRDIGRLDVRGIEADLARPETLAAAVGELRAAGDLDELRALVHCAGISPVVADATPDTWSRTPTVNLASAAELVRLTLPSLKRARGHVILVNASPGLTGVARWSAEPGPHDRMGVGRTG